MTTPDEVVLRARDAARAAARRLLVRDAIRLAGRLVPAALGLAFVPLFMAKWRAPSVSPDLMLLCAAAIGLTLSAALVLVRGVDERRGARALDAASGRHELVLTAIAPHRPLAGSRLAGAMTARVARVLEQVTPRQAVPLGRAGRSLRVLLVLLALDSALALTPDAAPEVSETAPLETWIDAQRDAATSERGREAARRLAGRTGRDALKAEADRLWRDHAAPTTALPADVPEAVRQLVRSLERGDGDGARAALDAAAGAAQPADREQLADALERAAGKATDARIAEALRKMAGSLRSGDASGAAATLARAALDRKDALEAGAGEVTDLLLRVYAQLGDVPPDGGAGAAGADSGALGGTASPRGGAPSGTVSPRHRKLVEDYFIRRRARQDGE